MNFSAQLKLMFSVVIFCFSMSLSAQMAINTTGNDPDPSAMLDVASTDKGFLIPRMTELQKLAIEDPAVGLMVYQTNGGVGFHYWNGVQWVILGSTINATGYPDLLLNNLVVIGSECVGLDCEDSESFGFTTLKLKENNTRLMFDDTSTEPGQPDNDWVIEANDSRDSGRSAFMIVDSTSGEIPFVIEANAGDSAFYIDSFGNVGIGIGSPTEKLHVAGDIKAFGNITATGTINCASDARIKEHIQPILDGMRIIEQLKPSSYYFKTTEYEHLNLPTDKQYGLIAQDLLEVMPSLVSKTSLKGIPSKDLKEIHTVNYIELIPILIQGIQEQESTFLIQESKLDVLKNELQILKEQQDKMDVLMKKLEDLGIELDHNESK